MEPRTRKLAGMAAGGALLAAGLLAACGGDGAVTPPGQPEPPPPAADKRPDDIRITWFGITNHQYQIGDLSFFQDGSVSRNAGTLTPDEAVDKTWNALKAGGAGEPSYIFIGHDHTPDHSTDSLRWAARFPKAKFIAAKSQCDRFVANNMTVDCLSLTPEMSNGKYVIKLNEFVEVRPVRWLHTNTSFCSPGNSGNFPTWGFLIKVDTKAGIKSIFSNDSGTGDNLQKEVVDDDGVNWGAPLTNLVQAMDDAGLETLDLWQGGPETRLIRQARFIVPLWKPKAFQPQHWADRDDIFGGIPFEYVAGPTYTKYLADNKVDLLVQQNYFDALVIDKEGIRRLPNPETKMAAGLPADGPGPKPLVPNPRLAQSPNGDGECPGD